MRRMYSSSLSRAGGNGSGDSWITGRTSGPDRRTQHEDNEIAVVREMGRGRARPCVPHGLPAAPVGGRGNQRRVVGERALGATPHLRTCPPLSSRSPAHRTQNSCRASNRAGDYILLVALPPHSFGNRSRAVRLDAVDEQRWCVTIDGIRLPVLFISERAAREAGASEVVRLDGLARAMLRHIRAGLRRKW